MNKNRIIAVCGAGLTLALAASPPVPASASANPCGPGYAFRASMAIDTRWHDLDPYRVKNVGVVRAYSSGARKCAVLTLNPAWKGSQHVTELLLQMSWSSRSGVGYKDAYGRWRSMREAKATSGLVAGPVKATVSNGCATLSVTVFMRDERTIYGSTRNGYLCI